MNSILAAKETLIDTKQEYLNKAWIHLLNFP
jgi:hypothetical protein